MSDPQTPPAASPFGSAGPQVPGWPLIVAVILFAVLVFAAAGLAWAGVAIVVALMAAAYAVLIRWSR